MYVVESLAQPCSVLPMQDVPSSGQALDKGQSNCIKWSISVYDVGGGKNSVRDSETGREVVGASRLWPVWTETCMHNI